MLLAFRPIWWQATARASERRFMAKGFGDGNSSKKKNPPVEVAKQGPWKVKEPRDDAFDKSLIAMETAHSGDENSLESYFNPSYLADKEYMKSISEKLRSGEVVVIPNALDPVLAEATHRDLRAASAPWEHNEAYFGDGYHYKHSNIYQRERWTPRLNKTMNIFESEASRKWMSELTGRDCSGVTTGAPSYYQAGDHSLPHTDWAGQRTVAYVWHLSKDWQPEWGGGLYWCGLPHAKATFHASFNTLVLFSVSTTSSHFVTTVSPHTTSKRLTFNGWYQSSWVPKATDDFSTRLATPEQRKQLTHTQLQTISDLLGDRFSRFESLQKREELQKIKDEVMNEFFPPSQ